MDELSSRIRRAFDASGAFEQVDETTWQSTTTAFEGRIEVNPEAVDDSNSEADVPDRSDADRPVRIEFDVTVIVPMLDAVTDNHVADVVEDGWFDTFKRRVADVSGITRRSRELGPTVRREGNEIVVTTSLTDVNPERGIKDAKAFIDFVEGTYVQGIIPGYDYVDPVAGILSRARRQGTAGDV
ncbi:DUF5813 family protein [Halopenitus sp. H-Gu1]|uniref:DUF5813 family protein n=1 Tax=Halopenitus sp. H-Gu1 TaxID=3242697 RepID=UPI00359DDDDE